MSDKFGKAIKSAEKAVHKNFTIERQIVQKNTAAVAMMICIMLILLSAGIILLVSHVHMHDLTP